MKISKTLIKGRKEDQIESNTHGKTWCVKVVSFS